MLDSAATMTQFNAVGSSSTQLTNRTSSTYTYLDHNATTPLADFLPQLIANWLEFFGNPSSIHQSGRKPKELMRDARTALAKMLGCDALELIFTSGGSESNNAAIKGVFFAYQKTNLP